MNALFAALKYLTIFPWPRRVPAADLGRASSLFPLVGLFLGLILLFFNWLLDPYLSSEILSVLLVTLLIVMTRAVHITGLRETFDGLEIAGERKAGSAAAREDRLRIFGLLAVVIVVALKFRAIEVMGEARNQGLLLAPVLGRWSMVVLAYGSSSQREGAGRILSEEVRGLHLFIATAISLALVAALSGRAGFWIALWVSLVALVGRSTLHRRLGGVAEDNFGAIEELTEAIALTLFASF